ncbi:hypothetical protein Y032_0015g2736 [Ancylostoma ceylanicum]|uniref:Uncharacterized protein n=1 Tax=Ancylostoma ceylanicum TaxID=53326 RepID=A0A016V9D5_9BILA|nr:hypothetical protein Y032_0015g2736 [Ancylostoma ceylanicum]
MNPTFPHLAGPVSAPRNASAKPPSIHTATKISRFPKKGTSWPTGSANNFSISFESQDQDELIKQLERVKQMRRMNTDDVATQHSK